MTIGSSAGHGVKYIGYRANLGPGMNVLACHAHGVARAIEPLMVLIDHHELAKIQVSSVRQLAVAGHRVLANELPFLLGQCPRLFKIGRGICRLPMSCNSARPPAQRVQPNRKCPGELQSRHCRC